MNLLPRQSFQQLYRPIRCKLLEVGSHGVRVRCMFPRLQSTMIVPRSRYIAASNAIRIGFGDGGIGGYSDTFSWRRRQQQQRSYTSKKRRQHEMILNNEKDPFQRLRLRRGIDTYATAKQKFLQIALQHHPDTRHSKGTTKDDDTVDHEQQFIQARQALEALVAGPDGIAVLKSSSEHAQDDDSEDDLNAWFKNQTGHEMPFMDLQTMKEVAKMTETVGGGLDRDGGMWTLARMVTESVKSGGNAQSVLQLEAGTVRDRAIDGILRRRRKR